MDPRQIFCLLAIAVRVAQRMGLHRDPAAFGHSPFEVEQRRRLWWTIVAYDGRIGEMTGSTVTAISSSSDTRLPLNINDTDLYIDAKDAPVPHPGATEMLFCLTRLELSLVVRSDSQRDSPIRGGETAGAPTPVSTGGAAAVAPIPTVRVANQEISYTHEGFRAHIEDQYLRHCDEKIPLHFFTLTMTRQALCK
ncbi:fungal specific transcription factor domain-containing protein, partial [Candidatus Bathyarchaeota archaeon]|nr:fungal specific transcription factor domain-containing protein [Candidatus Bathyarchaeota archaeon]